MTFDPSKLSPAPWCGMTEADVEFWNLARAAFDVTRRRPNWFAWPLKGRWLVRKRAERGSDFERLPMELEGRRWPDPFTALVEADRWYAANVETLK